MQESHPLYKVLEEAAGGHFPAVDGTVELMPADPDGTDAIIEFTGHSIVLSDVVTVDDLGEAGADGYGGATHPDVQRVVAGADGRIGCLDAVLVARGRGVGAPEEFTERTDLTAHPRVRRAYRYRRECQVFTNADGVTIVGDGVVGRREVSVELFDPDAGGQGAGRSLIEAALDVTRSGEPLWAQVSPGNTASLRAFLACGFVPVCSEILIHRTDGADWIR